jgi:hypothetical protein
MFEQRLAFLDLGAGLLSVEVGKASMPHAVTAKFDQPGCDHGSDLTVAELRLAAKLATLA